MYHESKDGGAEVTGTRMTNTMNGTISKKKFDLAGWLKPNLNCGSYQMLDDDNLSDIGVISSPFQSFTTTTTSTIDWKNDVDPIQMRSKQSSIDDFKETRFAMHVHLNSRQGEMNWNITFSYVCD